MFSKHADGGDAEHPDSSGFEPDSEHLLTRMVRNTAWSLTGRPEIIHLKRELPHFIYSKQPHRH